MSATIRADDLGLLLISAVRYAMGRQSYITGMTADLVVRYRAHLTETDRAVILRDYDEAKRLDNLGWDCDAKAWERMAAALRTPSGTTYRDDGEGWRNEV